MFQNESDNTGYSAAFPELSFSKAHTCNKQTPQTKVDCGRMSPHLSSYSVLDNTGKESRIKWRKGSRRTTRGLQAAPLPETPSTGPGPERAVLCHFSPALCSTWAHSTPSRLQRGRDSTSVPPFPYLFILFLHRCLSLHLQIHRSLSHLESKNHLA